MEHLDPRFKPLLEKHRPENLRRLSGAVYAVWDDLRLAYLNPAWFEFARQNGGEAITAGQWGLGASILESIPLPLRRFYEINLGGCLRSGQPWSHEYECSSPSVYRRFRQTAYPLDRQAGLLIVNSLVIDRPHDESRPSHPPETELYVNDSGFISQCSHCRLVKNVTEPERWDWVPDWLRVSPPNLSHTLCPACHAVYHPTD